VQKGPYTVFKHPSGHELEKANRDNIEFNKGVAAGHLRTLAFNSANQLNCPSGNTKEFCSGWKSARQSTLQQLTARDNDNNTATSTGSIPTQRFALISSHLFIAQIPFFQLHDLIAKVSFE
jgi:hypothetical protein